jgi:transposase-like protein
MSIPPRKVIMDILFENDAAISFLLEEGILYPQRRCEHCGSETSRFRTQWKCIKSSCRKSVSIFRDSFFTNCKIPVCDVLHIAYHWLWKDAIRDISKQTGHSTQTVSHYVADFRQLIGEMFKDCDQRIGGPQIVVELDETKLGKRKYNRGHHVEGVWVFGGVERTEKKRMFAVNVKNRTAKTLLRLIKKHVRLGSVVITDMFASYRNIEKELEMEHFTVNHSETFKDPVTGAHTNTIEGNWNGLKLMLRPRARTRRNIDEALVEFAWRRINKNNLWTAFLECLKAVAYLN